MTCRRRSLTLNSNFVHLTDAAYRALWERLGRIRVTMTGKSGKCRHEPGDEFFYDTPYAPQQGVCCALLHTLNLYAWRVALGFPSWEADDRGVYRVHCPSKNGTVWEMRMAPRG